MNKKKEFNIKTVIELVGDCRDCTLDDYKDLFGLKDCGFNNVRFVRDVFEDVGGCWIAEKDEYDVERDIHGGMLVKMSDRVGKMLSGVCESYEACEDENGIKGIIKYKVQELMYRLNDGLDKWDCDEVCNVLNKLRKIFESGEREYTRLSD